MYEAWFRNVAEAAQYVVDRHDSLATASKARWKEFKALKVDRWFKDADPLVLKDLGLSLDEMHIYSKIVAICDSFDAMTTDRVYQRAIDSFPALRIMFSLKGAYDEHILRAFVELMGPSGLAEL